MRITIYVKKFILLTLIFILPFFLQGCWWAWWAGTGVVSSLIDGKEEQRDEFKQAQTAEKYRRINERRRKIGMPPIEQPEYQREKNTMLY